MSALDLFKVSTLTFKEPDTDTFSLLACAVDSIKKGGAVPAVLNAANEIAVWSFLDRKIPFCKISEAVCQTVDMLSDAKNARTLDEILAFDKEARIAATKILKL
jgi:1-deoxy-D-xylulose-5-phosphate reductoisomerase